VAKNFFENYQELSKEGKKQSKKVNFLKFQVQT